MTADRVRNYEKVELNSSVLRWCWNVVSVRDLRKNNRHTELHTVGHS